ncbi:MAG: helix-turn-helix transcriptional regulator [Clostridiales Family XIII bacterium]|jgi:predicted XRE-type DNA-binding protein|nr:helix-turn-helix transcriptional regulator [Clostridiales Family XIII bacterium]
MNQIKKNKALTLADLENELLEDGYITPEEVAESNARANIMVELIKARNEQKISQRKLEELTGIRQPAISRIEKGAISPSIDTLLKVLAPLGKTLAVVPVAHRE